MKKYFLLSAISLLSLGALTSCMERTTDVVQTTSNNNNIPLMKDLTGSFNSANNFAIDQNISIASTDVVLVYRNINSNTSSSAVWQLLPKTSYLSNNRELDYNFVFNSQRVQVRTESSFDQTTMTADEANTYLNNQTFRIVLIPASKAGKSAAVDYNDYNAVAKYYNLK